MALQLYNTLTRKKERFEPIDPTNVRMYVCGPTVYDLAHIGNARPIIVFDVLFRLLRHIYGEAHVTYARNITDVDDKINARAVERWPDMEPTAAIRRLTEETAAQFHKDIAALGVLPPTYEPRATDNIAGMRDLCEALVKRGHAYVAQDHVLFDAGSMPDYGRLANRSLEEMEAGARIDVAPYKKGPMDFVLWKPSTAAQPAWPSPCGIATLGRPGWHIECSAMAEHTLWSEPKREGRLSAAGLAHPHIFDIHGGGIDLVFPHHENEIAQSRCALGTSVMANVWMHNGFLQVEGEKMSKSLGNFVTINELLVGQGNQGRPPIRGDVMRLTMLQTHYRQPINWTERGMNEALKTLTRWGALFEFAEVAAIPQLTPRVQKFLEDDLNTPGAIAEMHSLAKAAEAGDKSSAQELIANALFLGLPVDEHITQHNLDAIQHALIEERIAARLEARKRKDFKEGDRIRDELAAMGIQLKDSRNKETGEIETTWEVRASGTTELKR